MSILGRLVFGWHKLVSVFVGVRSNLEHLVSRLYTTIYPSFHDSLL